MANGFSVPSDVNPLGDLNAEFAREEAKRNPLQDLNEEFQAEETVRVAAAARWSKQFAPELYAEAAKLAPRVEPEVGARQIDLVREQARLGQLSEIFQKAPALRSYFSNNPKDLAYANPDELDNLSGVNWLLEAGPASAQAGMTMIMAAQASNRIARGQGTIQDRALVTNYNPSRSFGARGFWQEGLVMAGQQIAPLIGSLTYGAVDATQGAIAGGVAGGIAGSVVPGPGTVAGGAAGMVAGGKVGFTYGMIDFQRQLQTGLARIQLERLKDKDGNGLEPELVELAANVTGLGGAILEQVADTAIMKIVPGLGQFVTSFTPEGVGKALLNNPGYRGAFLNFAKNLGIAGGAEIGTEVLQQALQIASEEVVKANSEGNFQQKTGEEILTDLGSAAYQAFQVMAVMGPFISGTRFGSDLVAINRSKKEHDNLLSAMASVEGNALIERAPQVAANIIDEQAGGKKLYVDAQQFASLYQEQGVDPFGPPLPNWKNRLEGALAINGDVEISLGEFIAHFGKDPKANPLMELVRTNPSDYAPADVKAFSEGLDAHINSEITQAAAQSEAAAMKAQVPDIVKETLDAELAAAGFAPRVANFYSTMLSAYYNARAQQVGISPEEFLAEPLNQIKVIRESLEATNHTLQNVKGMVGSADELFQSPDIDTLDGLSAETSIGEELVPNESAPIYQDPGSQPGVIREPKGSITFDPQGPATIKLFAKADLSTLLHEAGHFFLNNTRDLAARSPEIAADWDIIKKHLGIDPQQNGKITREQHEKFARSMEAYFLEGKAPSAELRTVFNVFRNWLKAIYTSIQQLGGKVNPELAAVFDRMFVVERRVDEVANDKAYASLFKDAETMGVSPEEYLEYQQLVEGLRVQAQATATSRIVGQQTRLAKGWLGEIQKQLAGEAEARLRKTAPYNHMETFRKGGFAMDPKRFAEKKYGKEAVKKFPKKAFAANGMEPDVVAELLGYPSADEMVYDFIQAPPIKDAAKAEAQKELTTRFGEDYTSSETFDATVKAAFAEEGRVTILSKEFVALSRKAGRWVGDQSPKQLAEQIAKDNTYGKIFKDINPAVTQAAVRRAAALAESETLKGNWAVAADWKRKQLLAQAIDNEVQNVTRTVERIREKAMRYTRKPSKSISPAAMEQLRDLVTRYDFAQITTNKLQKRVDLRTFLENANAVGLVTTVSEKLQNETMRQSYKELSVEDLLAFGDALDNIEHLGRMEQKVLVEGRQVEFQAVKDEILPVIRGRKPKVRKEAYYGKDKRDIADFLSDWTASWLKPEQIIEWLDMGDISGPMMKYVFQPIAEAQNLQNEMNLEYNTKLVDIFSKLDAGYLTETVNIPSLGHTMTREQIFVAALNTGNESNRKKLLEGELWTEAQLNDVLMHMSSKDWDAAQKVWNIFNPLWDKISAMEKRLTGVAPPKIAAKEFTNQHGTFAGGYFPAVYDFQTRRGMNLLKDPTPVNRQSGDSLFEDVYVRPGTDHKHTIKRTGAAKPILLELASLPGHVHKVIHDLAYREAVRGAYKILWDADIRQAITDVESAEIYRQLQHWLGAVAKERPTETDKNVRLVQHARVGATIYGMGYRISTVLAQPLGLFNSLVRVSHKSMANGVWQMTRHPLDSLRMVNQMSGEMKSRFNAQDRDIRDTANRLTLKPSKINKIKIFSFYAIGAVDKWVSTATWLGAYQDQLSKDPTNERAALMHADRTVRLTQGTGSVKDMAKVTNDGEVLKLFTMFYSAFSAIWNMQVDLTRKTKNDINTGDWSSLFQERLPQWFYLVVMPSLAGALLTGQGPEEDENPAAWAARKVLLYPTAAMPFVRDVVGAAEFAQGRTYKFSPAGKLFESSAKSLGKLLDGDVEGAIRPTADALSIALQLPTGQLFNTIDAIWGGITNGDFEPQDLMLGRRDK